MKFTIITPNYNGAPHLAQTLESVRCQRDDGIDIQHILVDGASRDESLAIAGRYRDHLAAVISEPDRGPASAINKGLRLATGDVLAWLNADDTYFPGALLRVAETLHRHPQRALCFGGCTMVDETNQEIRRGITRFKHFFYPFSCRFLIQCINYVSQPAMFFRRPAFEQAGFLREDLTAAWDYEFLLRLWRHGGAIRVPGPPLAAFRRHETSISERHFRRQFSEELEAAAKDAGRWMPQTLIHHLVRRGIVTIYSGMNKRRTRT